LGNQGEGGGDARLDGVKKKGVSGILKEKSEKSHPTRLRKKGKTRKGGLKESYIFWTAPGGKKKECCVRSSLTPGREMEERKKN